MAVTAEGRPDGAPTAGEDGGADRPETIRGWITPDGGPGPGGEPGLPREPGRYRLYAALDDPDAHVVLLARAVLGLEAAVPAVLATPRPGEAGGRFGTPEPLFGAATLAELHAAAAPGTEPPRAAPLLVDGETRRAVSDRGDHILRMLDGWSDLAPRLRPAGLEPEIDAWTRLIRRDVVDGVARAGAAESQAVYETAALSLFAALERIEARLSRARWLCGETFTEADLALFPTLARFDAGYYAGHRCNLRRLTDHPHLWAYAREIYAMPGVAETVDFDLYRRVCNAPSPTRNPAGIVPIGPETPDWTAPHGRG
jgi:putative glutathione S-transferase